MPDSRFCFWRILSQTSVFPTQGLTRNYRKKVTLLECEQSKGTLPDKLYQKWLRGEINLITSIAQMAAVAAVLARPRLKKFLGTDEAESLVENVGTRALILDELPGVNLAALARKRPS